MMLAGVVSKVLVTGFPMDNELALANTVADTVKAHVNGFGSLLFNGVVDDTFGGGVVSLDGGRWLGVAEFFKSGVDRGGILGVVEEGTNFGFSGGG